MAVTGDSGGDDGGDSRWMTYAELAEARGIKEPAAVRLVQRRKWERQPGNDGAARIAVPLAELRPSRLVAPAVRTVGGDSAPNVAPDVHYVETLARERQRADQAEARADRAEGREADLRTAADRQGRELTAALLRTAIAETEVRALKEALDEARRPAWRRWLGWRP